jgi:hypothetical protein
MNTQRPLPNPFGPDKKIPFPNRAPQKIVPPASGVMTPPASLPPVNSPTLPPVPVTIPPKVKEQLRYEETAEYGEVVSDEVATDETDTNFEEYDDEIEYEEYYEEDEEDEYEVVSDEEDDFLGRIFASSSPTVAQQTLFALSRDSNWQVRNSVAMNLTAPPTLLNLLANDSEDLVRQTVMENLNTSDEIYANFANDESDDIQIAFIKNPRTTSELLTPLLETDNEFVAEALMESHLVSEVEKRKLHNMFD